MARPDSATRDEFLRSLDEASEDPSYDSIALGDEDIELLKQEITSLDRVELEALGRRLEWLTTARPKQLSPPRYFVWMLMAGRGSGKTRSGAEDIWWPASRVHQRIAVIGPTLADVRKTCFEGESGLMNVIPRQLISGYNRSQCELWMRRPRGGEDSYFVGYSSEEPERLRGPQHHRAWCDELAAWRYLDDTWDMMMFGLRLGDNPNVVVTTTPKPVGLVRRLIAEADTVVSRESTFANEANLPPKVMQKWREKYEGTRLGRQELNAEILDDNPYALWNARIIDMARWNVKKMGPVPDMERCVVAIDPPATSGEDADECGIIGAGIYQDNESGLVHALVTEDWSQSQAAPGVWAAKAIGLYRHMRADLIVAEANNGGEMVEHTIHSVDPNVPVKLVHATRGKVVRAEPISSFYEQYRVHHVGMLGALEDQMCDFTTDFDKEVMGYSPDRVDALVWALTELMVDDDDGYHMLGSV